MAKRKKPDQEPLMLRLAGTIRSLREAEGLSIRDFAEKAGVNHSDIFRLEAGTTNNPSLYLINSIAGAFGLTIDELMNFNAKECPLCKGRGWIREGEGIK